jgi:hypothetical protein
VWVYVGVCVCVGVCVWCVGVCGCGAWVCVWVCGVCGCGCGVCVCVLSPNIINYRFSINTEIKVIFHSLA